MSDLMSRRHPAATLSTSFSFYVPASKPQVAALAASLADGLTVAGPKGPNAVRKLRASGLDTPVLFDGLGYAGRELPPAEQWVREQVAAGADRALLPGIFVPWDKDNDTVLIQAIRDQARMASDWDATLLLAIDSRWLAKRNVLLADELRAADQPVALVLAHPADPLATGGAVLGLRWIAQRTPRLSVLRCDHGALGAIAFGAKHASIGLSTSTRHFASGPMRPHRLRDRTARLFVRPLLDWFRASEIAGWTAAGSDIKCSLPCCRGESLARFLDEDLDATFHNMNALADFAEYVLNAPRDDRQAEFLNACREAVARYGNAGFKGPSSTSAVSSVTNAVPRSTCQATSTAGAAA